MTSTAPITGPRILHSIHGNKFGLDPGGFAVSQDNKVIAATSATTGTPLPYAGIVTLSSVETTWEVLPPVPGLELFIQRLTTSTATTGTVNLQRTGSTNVTVLTSSLSTGQTLKFTGSASLFLVGLSTSQWSAQVSTAGNTSQVTVS